MESSQLSPHQLQDGEINLSSWTIEFRRPPIGAWTWTATHADGRTVTPVLPDPGLYGKKENAEAAAVKAIETVERGESHEEIGGFELQIRVRERRQKT